MQWLLLFDCRYIHSKNRAGLTYRLAVNHLADKSSEELKLMRGFRYTPGNHGGLPFERSKYNLKDVPANLDWRLYGKIFYSFILLIKVDFFK